ncbi:PLP-dependent aminotransferase family protein [Methanofollis formosanus]|uniref:PLP-dependent aminotransferase family protein n=1 Tax=Methanofollis formosanus TaxID=299308 RepID=A0A8G1A2X1_9EURY|nr:PLP-dependent aminotransferase family protein [Methanofollis formosanus]QYZ79451.1 PLP-dependent aminotransferase family protein [Methanofollis formosanus]
MTCRYAARMEKTPRSFIREILRVTESPEIISFAGGLPNPALIRVEEIATAARSVFESGGAAALQYATTEGYLPLREFIADRYRQRLGLEVGPEEILITSGSQQALDLIGKVVLDPGDAVAIERPGYLGAIQALSLYEPHFSPVPLEEDGPDLAALERVLEERDVRLFYGVPNSQNPTGITWSQEKREGVASLLEGTDTLFVEDDAYGELRFAGRPLPPVKTYLPDSTILTGSFSKIAAPGLRVGWICADPAVLERLVVAKQASDLHTSTLDQRILARYLLDTDLDAHVREICRVYGRHSALMAALIDDLFPDGVVRTDPDGGMFLWVTLPPDLSSMTLFERALAERVAILPGLPFYVDGGGERTVRLNFSNADEERITEGMHRLARAIGV